MVVVSIGPLVTWAACHPAIWVHPRRRVPPSWRTSGRRSVSRMDWDSSPTHSSAISALDGSPTLDTPRAVLQSRILHIAP